MNVIRFEMLSTASVCLCVCVENRKKQEKIERYSPHQKHEWWQWCTFILFAHNNVWLSLIYMRCATTFCKTINTLHILCIPNAKWVFRVEVFPLCLYLSLSLSLEKRARRLTNCRSSSPSLIGEGKKTFGKVALCSLTFTYGNDTNESTDIYIREEGKRTKACKRSAAWCRE